MRVVLAGAQSKKALNTLIEVDAPNVLVSYYYMRKQGDRGRAILERAKEHDLWVLCDSGAYTFKERYCFLRKDVVDDEGRTLYPDWYTQERLDEFREAAGNPTREEVIRRLDEYVEGYLTWLKTFAHLIDAYAELDLDMLIEERIWEWRERFMTELADTGSEIILTPHLYQSPKDWERLFKMATYIGMEAGAGDKYYVDFFARHMAVLKERKIKCHGWAMTSYDAMVKWPFYSVDSTSWLMGSQYGVTYKYGGNGKLYSHGPDYKNRRRGWKADCESAGIEYEDLINDKAAAVDRFNAYQWVCAANDLTSYVTNAYWLSDEEREDVTAQAREQFGTDTALARHDYSQIVQAKDLSTIAFARFCSTCFLNQKCPAYEPGATCSIAQRPELKDKGALRGMLQTMLELQTERVAFGVFSERVSGTPVDPQVSKEMQMLFGLTKMAQDIIHPPEELSIKVKGPGVLSRLFGGYGAKGHSNPAERPADTEESVIDIDYDGEDDG